MRLLIVVVAALVLTPCVDARRVEGCPERVRPLCSGELPALPDELTDPTIPPVPSVPAVPLDPDDPPALPNVPVDPDDPPALPNVPVGPDELPSVPGPGAVPHPCDRLPDSIQNVGVFEPPILGPLLQEWEQPRQECHETIG